MEPCIGMGTFDNRTLIFRQLDISSIGTSTIVGRVQHLFEEYRVLKENTGSLGTLTQRLLAFMLLIKY